MIRYEDLGLWEQVMVDRCRALPGHALIDLMDQFHIGLEHLQDLYGALGAEGELEFRQWQAETARRDRDALAAALASLEAWPAGGVFHFSDGKPVFDMLNVHGEEGELGIGTFIGLMKAVYAQAERQAALFGTGVERLKADMPKPAPRLKPRFPLWVALLRFWRDGLGRDFDNRDSPAAADQPFGQVIDFIAQASAHGVPAGDRTPNAIHQFIRRHRKRI